jgi:hypothetical protein
MGVRFLHHTEGTMGLRADFGRGNLWLAARLQPDVDVRDDVTRPATLRPALMPAAIAAFALFLQTAHGDALAAGSCEDPDDLIVSPPGPNDAVATRARATSTSRVTTTTRSTGTTYSYSAGSAYTKSARVYPPDRLQMFKGSA